MVSDAGVFDSIGILSSVDFLRNSVLMEFLEEIQKNSRAFHLKCNCWLNRELED